jgi:hypothetical protein
MGNKLQKEFQAGDLAIYKGKTCYVLEFLSDRKCLIKTNTIEEVLTKDLVVAIGECGCDQRWEHVCRLEDILVNKNFKVDLACAEKESLREYEFMVEAGLI